MCKLIQKNLLMVERKSSWNMASYIFIILSIYQHHILRISLTYYIVIYVYIWQIYGGYNVIFNRMEEKRNTEHSNKSKKLEGSLWKKSCLIGFFLSFSIMVKIPLLLLLYLFANPSSLFSPFSSFLPIKQWKWHITNHPFPSIGNTHHCSQQSFSSLETWASNIFPPFHSFSLMLPFNSLNLNTPSSL